MMNANNGMKTVHGSQVLWNPSSKPHGSDPISEGDTIFRNEVGIDTAHANTPSNDRIERVIEKPKTMYQPIDIDFEVYQLIMLEKSGFDETDNDALRRLLGLSPRKRTPPPPFQPNCSSKTDPVGWSKQGVWLPDGTKLWMQYDKKEYDGEIVNGKWAVAGKQYTSPSGAASNVAKISLNGWILWHVKRPQETHWYRLCDLRVKK